MIPPVRKSHTADVAISTVRPRLVTPVRSDKPAKVGTFETTYRPNRLVRHNAWETADDALRRDQQVRSRGGPPSVTLSH